MTAAWIGFLLVASISYAGEPCGKRISDVPDCMRMEGGRCVTR
jgi:hypothetical protein